MVRKHLPVGAIDVTASALARVAPRGLHPRIDQARHDLRALVGRRPLSTIPAGRATPRPLAEIDPVEHLLPTSRLRARYVTLRTDLRWLARDLSGAPRSPTIENRRSRYRAAGPGPDPLAARVLRVTARRDETPDAVTLTLAPRDGEMPFLAGQFLTFRLRVDGEPLRRAYSLCRAPAEGQLAVTVKRIDGGRGSGWMHAHAGVGTELEVLGPSGSFVLPPDGAPRELLLVAGGSGITPIRALAREALDLGWRVRLAYGNRGPGDVIFGDELRAWAAREPRFTLTEALESPPAGFGGLEGRLDGAALRGWLRALPAAEQPRLAFVCGPTPMREAAVEALREAGLPSGSIREERFQSPGQARGRAPLEDRVVTLRVGGTAQRVHVPAGATLLEAGLKAGAALPFSCAMGGCAACKVTRLSGEVEMDEPNCLSAEERAAGAVLTCCARAASDDVVLEVPR